MEAECVVEPQVKFEPAALALFHFGQAKLFDKRRTRRLVKTAELIMTNPRGTLPKKLASRSDLVGLYRLAATRQVTHARVLDAHRQRTLEAIGRQEGVVLLIHDTTELDFTPVTALKDQLGQIGNGSRCGYLCHNSLAVGLDPRGNRRVLGLASQVLAKRREVPKGETPKAKREHPDRESRLWVRGCEQVGAAPAGILCVDVGDRGADTIEFVEYEVRNGRHFLIRASKDRNLEGEDHLGADRIHTRLLSYAKDQPILGTRSVQVPAIPGKRKARVARVSLSAAPLQLRAGRFARGECQGIAMDLWVICVREIDPPADVEPLLWVLLSDLPAGTLSEAGRLVDWYECRPIVEDYHKGQKTGLGIESLRFEQSSHLEPVIALLSVAAVVLLSLREAARHDDSALVPATEIMPQIHVDVLAAAASRRAARLNARARPPVDRQMSIKEFVIELAKLGGFLACKNHGPPGWLTLWRGWEKLQLMVEGVLAMSG